MQGLAAAVAQATRAKAAATTAPRVATAAIAAIGASRSGEFLQLRRCASFV